MRNISYMVLLVFLAPVLAFAHAEDEFHPYKVDMGWYSENSSGNELVRDLLTLASPRFPLMLIAQKEEELVEVVDEILIDTFEHTLDWPVAEVIPDAANEILFQFLSYAGTRAFAQGATREMFLQLIQRRITPAHVGCESALSAARFYESDTYH